MASWRIYSVPVSIGSITITFFKDNGDPSAYDLTGAVLSLGKVKRAVEESGYGGNLRAPEMEIELLDVDGLLKSTVFGPDGLAVTVEVKIEGTPSYTVFYGDIDLGTVEFSSYYDNGLSTESHSCKFIAFDILKRLEQFSVSDLRAQLDGDKVQYDAIEAIAITNEFREFFPRLANNDSTPAFGTNWTNTQGGLIPDGAFASATLGVGAKTHYLKITGFGFDVPNTHSVIGVQVRIQHKGGGVNAIKDYSVKLIQGGTITGSDKASSSYWSSTEEEVVYNPDFDDTWTLTLTPADVNASDFGVAVSAQNSGGPGTNTAYIDSVKVIVESQYAPLADPIYFVKVVDIFKEMVTLSGVTLDATIFEHDVAQTFRRKTSNFGSEGTTDGTLSDLWVEYQNTTDMAYRGLFDASQTGGFYDSANLYELLLKLSGCFLCYPIFLWDANSSAGHIKLKQRDNGSALDLSSVGVMTSTSKRFLSYDAVKVTLGENNNGFIYPFQSVDTDYWGVNDTTLSTIWAEMRHKLEFVSYFHTTYSAGSDWNRLWVYVVSASKLGSITHVYDTLLPAKTTTGWTDYLQWLASSFKRYWKDTVKVLERDYDDAGVISPLVEVLDKVTVGAVDYAVLEHEFDIVNNEMNLKLVSY